MTEWEGDDGLLISSNEAIRLNARIVTFVRSNSIVIVFNLRSENSYTLLFDFVFASAEL